MREVKDIKWVSGFIESIHDPALSRIFTLFDGAELS